MDRESSFKFYSFGIVVADKERKSFDIRVVPVEEITLATGQSEKMQVKTVGANRANVQRRQERTAVPMGQQTISYDISLPDHKKITRSQTLEGGLDIVARWTAFGQSNRITPPDVIKGETVMIFRVSDSDEYFWTTLMNEPSIRRQETVCYVFGNLPDGIKAFDKDSSYWFEVSTHDKYIKLHTAKNDGELAAWDISLDTNKGILVITDNAGNDLTLNSGEGTLTGNIVSSALFKCPDTTFDGNVKVTGNTKVEGNSQVVGSSSTGGSSTTGGSASIGGGVSVGTSGGGGDLQISGNVNLTGNIRGSGSVIVDGIVQGSNTP
jgi:hypothetical protein